jgi:ribosome biogenesis protein BMS1
MPACLPACLSFCSKIDDPHCDRRVALYGYLHGSNLKSSSKIHIAGCGDFGIHNLTQLADPCPLPERLSELATATGDPDSKRKLQRKSLNTKDKLFYAPMCMYLQYRCGTRRRARHRAQWLIVRVLSCVGDVGNIKFDKDATYIDIPDNRVSFSIADDDDEHGMLMQLPACTQWRLVC